MNVLYGIAYACVVGCTCGGGWQNSTRAGGISLVVVTVHVWQKLILLEKKNFKVLSSKTLQYIHVVKKCFSKYSFQFFYWCTYDMTLSSPHQVNKSFSSLSNFCINPSASWWFVMAKEVIFEPALQVQCPHTTVPPFFTATHSLAGGSDSLALWMLYAPKDEVTLY